MIKMLGWMGLVMFMGMGAAKLPSSAPSTSSAPAKPLKIVCLDVCTKEVGDSFLIVSPSGKTMLIDAGTPGNGTHVVLPYLRAQGIKQIDLLMASHPHDDHFGSFAEILLSNEVTVRKVIWGRRLPLAKTLKYEAIYAQDYCEKFYLQIFEACKEKHVPIEEITAGQVIDLGDGVRGQILAAVNPLFEGPNNYINNNSIILRLTYGTFSMLFTGDAGVEEDAELLTRVQEVQADILKIAHHGGDNSTSEAFLQAVDPEAVIITTTDWLTVDPRSVRVRDLLKKYPEIKVYRTSEFGQMEIQSDGTGYQIITQRGNRK